MIEIIAQTIASTIKSSVRSGYLDHDTAYQRSDEKGDERSGRGNRAEEGRTSRAAVGEPRGERGASMQNDLNMTLNDCRLEEKKL